MNNMPSVFRFAPSPNGHLHLGHAYSALLNYQLAMEMGGRFFVRVEDIDQTRCTPELERAMLSDLAWLGVEWEEPVRRQSMHFDEYAKALERLEAFGLTYRSQLSRGDVRRIVEAHENTGEAWPRDPDGAALFPGEAHERDAADADNNFAIRLKTQAAVEHVGGPFEWQEVILGGADKTVEADPTKWGDVVLARRDTPTSYHLSVVIDDAIQGVSHIVRGSDLYEATSMHVLLQKLLGLPKPLYHHHALILDENDQKLSKSKDDTSIAQLRQAGATPNEIRQMVGL